MTAQAACPECDHWVSFPAPAKLRQRVLCPVCRSELVVNRVSPLELDWAFIDPLPKYETSEGRKIRNDRKK